LLVKYQAVECLAAKKEELVQLLLTKGFHLRICLLSKNAIFEVL